MKRFILVLFGLSTFGCIYAQSLKNDLSLDKYSNQIDIQAFRSITLTNGFHIPVQTSKTVTISISGIPAVLSQPSVGQNYILTRTFRDSIKVGALGNPRSIGQENQTIQYFDGLGRPSQTVELMASPTYKDIVQHVEYDAVGRESIKYLPYADKSGNGSFRADAKTIQGSFYAVGGGWDATVTKTNQPYAVTVFENSPLNRVKEQGAPGAAWQPPSDRNVVASTTASGRTVVSEYGTNGSDDVKLWTVDASGNGASASYYVSGKLSKTVVKNENWVKSDGKVGTVEEFTDFDGRVVLKRVWNINSQTKVVYPLETQYVYDDLGDLRYVIPPAVTDLKFTEEATDPNFDKYIYAYKYDGLRRVIEKKIPGKGWDHFVYNKNDQLLQEQDAELRKTNKWIVTKYDALGRVVITGLHLGSHPRDDEQKYINKETALWESRDAGQPNYSNLSYPRDNFTVHTITYYDDYSFQNAGLLPAKNITPSTKTNSLVTGVLIYRDNGTLPLLSINYYDDYGNVIQTASQNHLGGTDYVTNTYSFAGELLASSRLHTPETGASATIVTTNAYDHVGRLVSTKEKIGAQAEVELASNRYNEIGQLKIRYMGKTQAEPGYVDTTSYTYHERGWIKRIASTNFTMSLMYQDGGTVRQYNGNIAQQMWRFTPSSTTSTFEYSYDKLGRLTSGTNGQSGTASIAEVMSYDDMGNIKTLKRDALDVTNYTYNGNKLTGVAGAIKGDYTYYDNGNAKTDRQGTTYTYNYLNLPQTALKSGTAVTFQYDAGGAKLQKLSKVGTSSVITSKRDYIDGIEYNNGNIDIIHNSVGYAMRNGANYVYHYNLTDHLGNVRTTLKRGGSATTIDIVQRDNYYPFGKRKVVAGGNNKYLYNGKEIQGELGDQYDYGARLYDAEIGRWNLVDPMSETHYDVGSYAYVLNNPILYGDLMGLDTTSVPNNNQFTPKEWHDFDTNNSEVRLNEVTATGKTSNTGNILSQAYYAIRNAGSDHPYFARRPYDVAQYHRQVNAARDPLMDIANVASVASGVGDGYLLARGGIALVKAGIPLIMRRWAQRQAFKRAVVGMTEDAAIFASQSKRADHAMRHLVDQGVISGSKNSTLARKGWGDLVSNVLTNPTKSFDYFLQGAKTKGFYKVVNGQEVVLFVTKHDHGSVLQGQVIGGWVPSRTLNPDILKIIGR